MTKARTLKSRFTCDCGTSYTEVDYGTHKSIYCEACRNEAAQPKKKNEALEFALRMLEALEAGEELSAAG